MKGLPEKMGLPEEPICTGPVPGYHGEWVWRSDYILLRERLSAALLDNQRARWVSVGERLPDDETPVLILHHKTIRIAELRWERPAYEETFPPFRYWDDPENDGQDFEWGDVTHWMPLPADPTLQKHDLKI